MSLKGIVEELWSSAHYRKVVDEIAKLRPVVPEFNHAGESNIETIKFKLAQQQYHDLIIRIIKPEGV